MQHEDPGLLRLHAENTTVRIVSGTNVTTRPSGVNRPDTVQEEDPPWQRYRQMV